MARHQQRLAPVLKPQTPRTVKAPTRRRLGIVQPPHRVSPNSHATAKHRSWKKFHHLGWTQLVISDSFDFSGTQRDFPQLRKFPSEFC
jgi:hypothetical protein